MSRRLKQPYEPCWRLAQGEAAESLGTLAARNMPLPAERGPATGGGLAGGPRISPLCWPWAGGLCRPEFHAPTPAPSTGGAALLLIVNGPTGPQRGPITLLVRDVALMRLHVEHGFRPEDSKVTLYASNILMGVYNQLASTPEPLLLEFADAVCNPASPNVYGFNQSLLVLACEHAEIIKHRGWSRLQVQAWVIQKARRRLAGFKRAGRLPGEIRPKKMKRHGATSCATRRCIDWLRGELVGVLTRLGQ